MIDTLMALWNQGTRGRGIMVTTAFFIICISISLLLIPIENTWTSWLSHQGNSPGDQSSIISSTDLTATARANNIQPTADNTMTIYAPTATPRATPTKPSANPCPVASVTHTTPVVVGTTPSRGDHSPTPIPTATHGVTPTSTPIPSPTPTNTPTPSPTPTNTPVPSPTPTNTPVPSVTPTHTPIASVTPTNTPIASVTPTPRKTPTVPATLTTGPTNTTQKLGEGITQSGQQGNNPGHTNCLHIRVGDSLDMYSNAHILANLEHNLGFILVGSTLGTLFFYVIIYYMARKKKV
jgi:outer membrane biosynthesis protein TonB